MTAEQSIFKERLDDPEEQKVISEMARLTLQVCSLTDSFSRVERIPRLTDGRRENDVEHSFALALLAPEIAKLAGEDELDIDKIRQFALVHDLLEVKVGDVATFDLTADQLEEKARLEQIAKEELISELPLGLAKVFEEYEAQDTREAVFVRVVDKLLPVAVDTTGDGVRVMREDYGVHTPDQLAQSHAELNERLAKKFGSDFPNLMKVHRALLDVFEDKYQRDYEKRTIEERPRNPTEVERKFIVHLDDIPAEVELSAVPSTLLRQVYVAIGSDGSETRVRSFNDERFEMTIKSPGTIARSEQNVKISAEMFDSLWQQTEGQRVEKQRYYIPLGDHTIELDIYKNNLEGLVTAEVEFSGRETEAMIRATSFEPPSWFGEDVSDDQRYKNKNLAQQGLPHAPLQLGKKQY